MRHYSVLLTIFVLAAGLLWLVRPGAVTEASPAAQSNDQPLRAITLIFGTKDREPAKWDGSASLSAGRIDKIVGHHFPEAGKIMEARSWQVSTSPWGEFSGGMHPDERPQPQPNPVVPVGVTIHYRAPEDALMSVDLDDRGQFSFRLNDVPETGGIFPLRSDIEIYRTPVVQQITDAGYEDDYPSVAADGANVWVAWQAYRDGGEEVFVRRWANGTWSQPEKVTEKKGDLFHTAIAASDGTVTVAWSEQIDGSWVVRSRTRQGERWGAVENVTSAKGSHLFVRAAGRGGNTHLVYQGWRGGNGNAYLRSRIGGRWMEEVKLSNDRKPTRANDWAPSVAVDAQGVVWAAWDSYETGAYNIYARSVRNNLPGQLMAVTQSNRFQAHPSLAVDRDGRVWVAYDEGPENWGKDTGFMLKGGTGLYQARTIRVAVYDNGVWMSPLRQPEEVVPYGYKRYFHTPRLGVDAAGRIWLFARPRTSSTLPTSLWAAGGKWEVVGTYYDGDRWSELVPVPESIGRNEGELAVATDSSGGVHVALVTDQRFYAGPRFGHDPRENEVMFASLHLQGPVKGVKLAPRVPDQPAGLPVEPREAEQIAALRAHAIQVNGKKYGVYRGDMHRHTDISLDGAGDGSLWDAYRYAFDATDFDYFMVTDHQSGNQEYTWWRIEKAADMFNVPGFLTTMYGTERSLSYPNGHRNLVFTKRGIPLLPITEEERKGDLNTGKVLYPYLKKYQGIAMSHTSHTSMGTDWRDNDPEVEPIVEIFQGARTSAEHEGAPLAPTEARTELWAGAYRPLGFVWNAWAKGYKLGVQASSDHVSTHTSYACLIAESTDRMALMDAIKKRHTYAATSNILLDYRASTGGSEYLQGDIFEARQIPELKATIVGTGPLKEVVVVRDNEYVYSQKPQGEKYDLRFRENGLAPGEHYYYVRVEQQDGNVAWSSPVWVTYRR